MITERARPLALQAILYFFMARTDGKSRAEAEAEFIGSELCRAFGDGLTLNNVDGLAAAAGYELTPKND
jgi:hypothetical protein